MLAPCLYGTRDEGQTPFSFPVDMGKVIKGWDIACMSMKKGESARFVIPSRMGYGRRGFAAWKYPFSSLIDIFF
ncbi:hypothetical protein BSL78_05507 [Apostichopus japonicus]|uniref:peptidylprolyl isomerase n=1 Tax=Stichopus japonicus TaxID=307972 RepID=A0A2G8LBH6_STIJA|nr:hypothetical protein BSL78_05507 [Apostichopus japonicus]